MRKNEAKIRRDILSAKYDCAQIAIRQGVSKSHVSTIFKEMVKAKEIGKDHFVEERRGRYYPSEQAMMKDPVYAPSGLIGEELQMFLNGTPPGFEFR